MTTNDYADTLTMPDRKELLAMIEEAKEDSLPNMPCGLDHLRLMRVIREYGDRRYRAGVRDATISLTEGENQ